MALSSIYYPEFLWGIGEIAVNFAEIHETRKYFLPEKVLCQGSAICAYPLLSDTKTHYELRQHRQGCLNFIWADCYST